MARPLLSASSLISIVTIKVSMPKMKWRDPVAKYCDQIQQQIQTAAGSGRSKSVLIAATGRLACNGRRWEVGGNGSSATVHGAEIRCRLVPVIYIRVPRRKAATKKPSIPRRMRPREGVA